MRTSPPAAPAPTAAEPQSNPVFDDSTATAGADRAVGGTASAGRAEATAGTRSAALVTPATRSFMTTSVGGIKVSSTLSRQRSAYIGKTTYLGAEERRILRRTSRACARERLRT